MQTIEITSTDIHIDEKCHIIDRGIIDHARIVIGEGLHVEYCFIAPAHAPMIRGDGGLVPGTKKYSRHIQI